MNKFFSYFLVGGLVSSLSVFACTVNSTDGDDDDDTTSSSSGGTKTDGGSSSGGSSSGGSSSGGSSSSSGGEVAGPEVTSISATPTTIPADTETEVNVTVEFEAPAGLSQQISLLTAEGGQLEISDAEGKAPVIELTAGDQKAGTLGIKINVTAPAGEHVLAIGLADNDGNEVQSDPVTITAE